MSLSSARVSIIIPCFNAGRWLAASLESAFSQSWKPTEVILVDDGSTDDSLHIAERYLSRGLVLLRQQNRGASAARNAGIQRASGAYIQFLDADDLLASTKIEQQMSSLLSAGPDVLCSAAWARFSNHPSEASFERQPNWRDLSGVEFLQLHYETLSMMQPGAWLASRKLIERAGPWNETLTLNDDGEFFARVMLRASRIVFVESARVYYRSSNPVSLSRRKDPASLHSLFKSVELTTGALLDRDRSPRTLAAVAYAWKWTAFEVYPALPSLAREAERRSRTYGGSRRPFPAGRRFQLLASLFGWRLARRLC